MSKARTSTRKKSSEANDGAPAQVAAPASPDLDMGAGGAELDKVRTILFGAQSRDYDRRFARLEELVVRELGTLRDTVARRFDALEAYVKKENEAFNKRLLGEKQQRAEAENKLNAETKDVLQTLHETRAQLDEQIAESDRSLREDLLSQAKRSARDMEQGFETLTGRLEEHVAALHDEKADRHSLADLFDELSTRLRNGFQLPTEEGG